MKYNHALNSLDEIIALATHVKNGGNVQFYVRLDNVWKDAKYTIKFAPFDFNNTLYRISEDEVKQPVARYTHYYRKHIPSGDLSCILFSQIHYSHAYDTIGGMLEKDARRQVDDWDSAYPDQYRYALTLEEIKSKIE